MSWLEERKQLEEVFGDWTVSAEYSAFVFEKGERYLFGLAGFENQSDSVQGATRTPLPIYGLLPLLILKNRKLNKVWHDRPAIPFCAELSDRAIVSAALWPEELEKQSERTLGQLLRVAPDWGLSVLTELRSAYAKKDSFIEQIVFMGFDRAERFNDTEIDSKLGDIYGKLFDMREARKNLKKTIDKAIESMG